MMYLGLSHYYSEVRVIHDIFSNIFLSRAFYAHVMLTGERIWKVFLLSCAMEYLNIIGIKDYRIS